MAPEGVGTSLGLFGSQVKDTRKLSKGEFVEWVSPLQPFWESTWKSVHPNGLTTRKDLAGVFIFWDAGSAQPKDARPWGNEASWAQQCGSMICFIKKKVSLSLCPQILPSVWTFSLERCTYEVVSQEAAVQGEIIYLPALVLSSLFVAMQCKVALIPNISR